MKKFRLLNPDEIECRVSTCNEKGVSLLLYKTARTDADLLDETVGCEKWVNDFKVVDGTLYGGLGVDYGNGMVWKWDAGVESNTEKEKGRASDAFKRAGFKHGIGRELYSAPFIWIPADRCTIKQNNKGKLECKDNFEVSEIGYDEAERITSLVIVVKGSPVYRMGEKINFEGNYSQPTQKPATVNPAPRGDFLQKSMNMPKAAENAFRCNRCGKDITDREYDWSMDRYKQPLCRNCQKKA